MAVGGLHGHHCHGNAECINTVGSYRCQCPPGYEHIDPYTCTGRLLCLHMSHLNLCCAFRCFCHSLNGRLAIEGQKTRHCTVVHNLVKSQFSEFFCGVSRLQLMAVILKHGCYIPRWSAGSEVDYYRYFAVKLFL